MEFECKQHKCFFNVLRTTKNTLQHVIKLQARYFRGYRPNFLQLQIIKFEKRKMYFTSKAMKLLKLTEIFTPTIQTVAYFQHVLLMK